MKTLRMCIAVGLLAVLAGCAPRFSPVLADYQLRAEPAPSIEAEVAPGQSLMTVLDRFVQPAYSPRVAMTPAAVEGGSPGPMDPEGLWVNWWRLDDGTLLLSAPAYYARGLGLRVDESGTVAGRLPWFDLRRKVRPRQEPWGERMRSVFRPVEPVPLDIFQFDLLYGGMEQGEPVLLLRDFKHGGPYVNESRIVGAEAFSLRGIEVRVLEASEGRLRYRIAPIPPARPGYDWEPE